MSRPKIPKIFRKSKGESSVAESLKVDKKSALAVIPPEEEEEVSELPSSAGAQGEAAPRALVSLNPTEQGRAESEIDIGEVERPRKLSSTKVQPTLVPSQTTGRVKRKSVC